MAQPAAVPQQAMDPNPQPSDTTPAQPTAPGPPASSEGSVTEKGLGVANGERGASKTSVIEDPADRVVPAALNQTSSSFSSEVDEKKPAKKKRGLFKKKDKEGKGKKDDDDDDLKPISIIRLFRFATPFELTLNMIGMVLACAAGATQPLMTLIFGRLTSAFNDFGRVARRIQEQGMTPENAAAMAAAKVTLRKEAGNNALYLMAIGLGLFLCTYVYMLIWNWTCERQNKRIREKYLHAVLRQEVSRQDVGVTNPRLPTSTSSVPARSRRASCPTATWSRRVSARRSPSRRRSSPPSSLVSRSRTPARPSLPVP
jgi:ATP-binding cassette subfamily B (MDR/TAP) protein 1